MASEICWLNIQRDIYRLAIDEGHRVEQFAIHSNLNIWVPEQMWRKLRND